MGILNWFRRDTPKPYHTGISLDNFINGIPENNSKERNERTRQCVKYGL